MDASGGVREEVEDEAGKTTRRSNEPGGYKAPGGKGE